MCFLVLISDVVKMKKVEENVSNIVTICLCFIFVLCRSVFLVSCFSLKSVQPLSCLLLPVSVSVHLVPLCFLLPPHLWLNLHLGPACFAQP